MKNERYTAGWKLFLLFVLISNATFAQNREESVIGRIQARMLQAEQKDGFSGVVHVAKGERVLLNQGFGWADPFVKLRNATDKRFMIASVSKAFAAAAILQLEERGLLNTSDLIGKYLPDYPEWAGKTITIHQLLTHTSGIPDYINDFPLKFKVKQITGWTPSRANLIASFQDRPLNFYPGENFKYSNSGYVLLARIVEIVGEMDYEKYISRNILQRLGMDKTGLGDFDKIGNRAVAFKGQGDKKKPINNFKSEWIYGMGEMYSTAEDLNKWLFSFADTLILSEASKAKMFTAEQSNYGYGWHVYDMHGHQQYSHGGYLPGWNSYLFYYPEDTLSIIVLCNVENANPMSMCGHISRIIYLNRLDQHEIAVPEKYAGRYALELENENEEPPFEAEIVTVNEDRGSLKVKTPKGKTLRFTRLDTDEWQDIRAEMRLQFRETGGNVFLQVSQNGHHWRLRKLSGDYQPAGTTY